jgi:phosphatidate cytidylyltransferase
LFPAFLISALFTKKSNFEIFSPTLFGILFVILPFCYLILFFSSVSYYNSENNARIVLGFFFLIWANDTFAYLVGRSLGKTKLFERVSPKKTWEGTIGGAACTQGIAWLISLYFTELLPVHWHLLAVIVSVFGTLGDLVESMFKRSLGVKDSGNILPGHGGILDRFDGVLLSAPFAVSYLMLIR